MGTSMSFHLGNLMLIVESKASRRRPPLATAGPYMILDVIRQTTREDGCLSIPLQQGG